MNTSRTGETLKASVLSKRVGEFLPIRVGGRLELALRLRERDARLEPRRGDEVVTLIGALRVELERHPDVRLVAELRRVEVAWRSRR